MTILKETIMKLYQEHYEISEMLGQLDWTALEVQWQKEMDARISREDADRAANLLADEVLVRYDQALLGSMYAMTREINNMLDLITIPTNTKPH